MIVLSAFSGSLVPGFWTVNLGLLLPLALSCLVLVVVIPSAARRGKLNVPVYALMLFGASFLAFFTGRLAGAKSVHGTLAGVVVSLLFFLLVASAVGCFLGMFFYRQPSDDLTTNRTDEETSNVMPALDEEHR